MIPLSKMPPGFALPRVKPVVRASSPFLSLSQRLARRTTDARRRPSDPLVRRGQPQPDAGSGTSGRSSPPDLTKWTLDELKELSGLYERVEKRLAAEAAAKPHGRRGLAPPSFDSNCGCPDLSHPRAVVHPCGVEDPVRVSNQTCRVPGPRRFHAFLEKALPVGHTHAGQPGLPAV